MSPAEPPPSALEVLRSARLYLLVTRALCAGPLEATVDAACRGGVRVVQVREKDADDEVVAAVVRTLLPVVRAHGALLLVNDRVGVAAATGADGAHIGPEDATPAEARAVLGPGRILGVTTHGLAQARRAAAEGADYIGIGPVFPTETKGVPIRVIGVDAAATVTRTMAPLPAFAIGGIGPGNAGRLGEAGCDRVAVCAAVLRSADPEAAARGILRGLEGRGGGGVEEIVI